jgi:hypothetical protein
MVDPLFQATIRQRRRPGQMRNRNFHGCNARETVLKTIADNGGNIPTELLD